MDNNIGPEGGESDRRGVGSEQESARSRVSHGQFNGSFEAFLILGLVWGTMRLVLRAGSDRLGVGSQQHTAESQVSHGTV